MRLQDKIKIYGAKVKVDSMAKTAEIEEAEKQKMRVKCEKILAHKDKQGQPMNVFINRQLIYNFPEQIFTAAGAAAPLPRPLHTSRQLMTHGHRF